MSDSITIREYEEKDKDEVINLIRLNTPAFFAVEEEEEFSSYLEKERDFYYVLCFGQKIIGCGGINLVDNNTTGRLSWDILHPEYQGKSLGTKLLRYRIAKLNTIDGIQKIEVRTSQLVYKFYEQQGFELLGVVNDFWAKGIDMYYMKYKKEIIRSQ